MVITDQFFFFFFPVLFGYDYAHNCPQYRNTVIIGENVSNQSPSCHLNDELSAVGMSFEREAKRSALDSGFFFMPAWSQVTALGRMF